ncbi:TauD/TfdA family dioxygenase [Pseudomonas putida]|uniref:TauD/TfdA family dioxygenase n=1 Tax=Pseudomonas putida TaxID=303 RepID=UPI000E6AEF10|nr:TauD/TfdA family dioxygenase [Pseudomonas putida]RIZ40688.1 gamma-butyrobetaine hydroxylase [Pseudomonas putida]
MNKKDQITFQATPPAVLLATDSQVVELPALWLREQSPDPEAVDSLTRQRLFDSHLLDENLSLIRVALLPGSKAELAFSDGHSAIYDASDILAETQSVSNGPSPQAWDSSLALDSVTHDWPEMDSDEPFAAALESYLRFGFIVLRNVPCDREQVLRVGSKFGYVKETNFGKYFEVYTKPLSNDLAYRSVRLGPHTDNPYRDPVPGIQLLHCLINETTGGLSTLVDSVSVVEALKKEDIEGYELLRDIPVRFRFIDMGVELTASRPMIDVDDKGRTVGVHYSPRLDQLPLLSSEQTRTFHRARKRLAELFNSQRYELKFRLQSGELMLFDNSRVLHGRTSYNPNEGLRHLQGCYIDRDGPQERYSEVSKRTARKLAKV